MSVKRRHVCCMRYLFVLNSRNVPFSCEYFVFQFSVSKFKDKMYKMNGLLPCGKNVKLKCGLELMLKENTWRRREPVAMVSRKLNKVGRYNLHSSPYIRVNKLKSVRWAQHIARMRSGCR